MKINAVLENTVPLVSSIRNAVIDFSQMTASIVAVVTDVVRNGRRVVGYGFNSNGRYPQGGTLRERIIPRLMDASPDRLLDESGENLDPRRVWSVMMANEKPGGHGERSAAVGAVDMALWDAVAKIAEQPLCRLLADRFHDGQAEGSVYTYAAGGYYYPDKGVAQLQDELRGYLDLGYESVKMKVGGAPLTEDLRRIEGALQVVGSGEHLAVDANARFDLEPALEFGDAIESLGLKWYEEPCDPLDYESLAEIARASRTPIATGENLFSLADTRNLVRYGGLDRQRDILQMDPALSYGLVEYLRMLRMLGEHGWSSRRCIPHGGHQFALHIAAGLGLGGNESYPHVFHPFGGFGDGVAIERGRVRLPDVPGIGFELKGDLMPLFESLVADHT